MKQIESLLKQDAKWSACVNERRQKESLLSSKYFASPDQGIGQIIHHAPCLQKVSYVNEKSTTFDDIVHQEIAHEK
jgi:hypothetical protein